MKSLPLKRVWIKENQQKNSSNNLEWLVLCRVVFNPRWYQLLGRNPILMQSVKLHNVVVILAQGKKRLMPFPFTGPKMFCAGPNFLCQTKNLFT